MGMPEKHQKNNRGFSLIELLVAIAILGVVTIPLLHSFLTSARTNSKAKKTMEATSVAQNLFEELKASDLDGYLSADTANTTKETFPTSATDTTPLKDVHGNQIYKYTRKFDGVEFNGRKFYAEVILDPMSYTTKEGETVGTDDYNSQPYANLSGLSRATNAFYIQPVDQEIAAAKSLDLEHYQQVLATMERTIYLKVEHDEASKLSKVFVTVTYTDGRAAGVGSVIAVNNQEIYNNSAELTNTLSNLFVCFYPMYTNANTTDRLHPKETIIIENTSNYKMGVYLVKQTGRDDAPAYSANKPYYSMGLTVDEGLHTNDDDSTTAIPYRKDKEDGSAEKVPNVITSIVSNLKYETDANTSEIQLTYQNNGAAPPANAYSMTPADLLGLKAGTADLTRASSQLNIYKVTINVYDKKDAGAYEGLLTTMEGTKIQ